MQVSRPDPISGIVILSEDFAPAIRGKTAVEGPGRAARIARAFCGRRNRAFGSHPYSPRI